MIVDCHCHAGHGDGLTGPWNTAAPIGTYLKRARAVGIAKTVVFAPLHLDYARANAEVAGIVRAHPGRLIGLGAHDAGDLGVRPRVVEVQGSEDHRLGDPRRTRSLQVRLDRRGGVPRPGQPVSMPSVTMTVDNHGDLRLALWSNRLASYRSLRNGLGRERHLHELARLDLQRSAVLDDGR